MSPYWSSFDQVAGLELAVRFVGFLERFYAEQLWTAASGPYEVLRKVNVLEIKNSS